MLNTLLADFRIIFERDPAARNPLEVILCYPGLHALWMHRFAHLLHRLKLPLIPRFLSHAARFLTGIEIHPGAQIGKGVFIDHGMGVVIGETAIVGDYALIYQGVTLGGTGKQSGKRHPTLGENVVVGTGAKVLGNLTIGENVRIGAGSVVLRDVPSDCTVVGIPGRIVYRSGVKVNPLEHANLPDSEAQVIRTLLDRLESLEQEVTTLRSQLQAQSYALTPVGCYPWEIMKTEDGSLEEKPQAEAVGGVEGLSSLTSAVAHYERCWLKDRSIEEFLDGSGI